MYNLTKKEHFSFFYLYQITEPLSLIDESVCFLCVLEGTVSVSASSRETLLLKGDLLLLAEEGPLLLAPQGDALLLSVHFDPLFFRQSFGADLSRLSCNSAAESSSKGRSVSVPAGHGDESPKARYTRLRASLAKLCLCCLKDDKENRFLIQSQICSVFHLLSQEFLLPADAPKSRPQQKLSRLLHYLQQHSADCPTLQEAAAYMGYTPPYLSNFIKKHLGCTYRAALSQARLSQALLLIKHRSMSSAKIAACCGFSTPQSFDKLFTETYHQSPDQYRSAFRRRMNENSRKRCCIQEPSLIRKRLARLAEQSPNEPALIQPPICERCCLPVNAPTPYEKNWNQIINLGHALSFENPQFRQHVMQIQQKFHFTHGRFGGILQLIEIFYDDTAADNRPRRVFNFSRAFQLIDFLLELNLKPHMDFGGKPFDIYLTSVVKSYQSQEDYLEHLALTLESFLCSCINHYGYDEVSGWSFEYWMYYNNTMSELDSPTEYCRQFSFFYHTIKNLLPSAKVGGPGFNLFLSLDIFQDILKELKGAGLTPDYLSVLFYPYVPPADYGKTEVVTIRISQNPNLLFEKIEQALEQIRQVYGQGPALYVTEYGSFMSPMNFSNDSLYQGSFILKQTLQNLDHAPVLAYWLATDYSMQYPDSAELLFGGNGLLTKDGICKPGYYAFDFLTRLGEQLIGLGEHYIVTCSTQHEIQIILFYYTHFFREYCENPTHSPLLKNPDDAFADVPPLQITLTLSHMEPGYYRIGQYALNQEHGSIFNAWRKLDYARHMLPSEIEHLKNSCAPKLTISRAYAAHSIEISRTLQRNEVIMLTLHYMY